MTIAAALHDAPQLWTVSCIVAKRCLAYISQHRNNPFIWSAIFEMLKSWLLGSLLIFPVLVTVESSYLIDGRYHEDCIRKVYLVRTRTQTYVFDDYKPYASFWNYRSMIFQTVTNHPLFLTPCRNIRDVSCHSSCPHSPLLRLLTITRTSSPIIGKLHKSLLQYIFTATACSIVQGHPLRRRSIQYLPRY